MKDKDYTKLLFIALALLALWWLWRRHQASALAGPQPQAPTTTVQDPEQVVFENGPPPISSANTLNVNISNQGLGYLSSQYIPLFGFVGMAQGVAYQ